MCNILTDNNGCIGEVTGSVTGSITGSAADQFFQLIANGARDLLGTVSTFWMDVPSPEVASGSGQNWTGADSITSIQAWISPVAFVIFLVSMGLVLLKIANDTRRAGEGFNAIVRSLVTTLAGGLPLLAITMLLIQFGDAFSPWVLEQASGEDTSEGFEQLFVMSMMGNGSGPVAASGALLIIYLLAILGAIMQCFFMVVRGAAIIVLLSFAQVTAAGTATEEGWLRFKRICLLVLGFVLYKPVAAVIYGVGLKLMSTGTTTDNQVMNAIYGLTVMVMAALALPAVIKFVAPSAAMGSSSAFSGGTAVGVAAAGAAVVALAGTGGGAAATGAAGGSSGGSAGGWGGGSPGGSGAADATGATDNPTPSGGGSHGGDSDSDSGSGGGSDSAVPSDNSGGSASSGGEGQSSNSGAPGAASATAPDQNGGGSGASAPNGGSGASTPDGNSSAGAPDGSSGASTPDGNSSADAPNSGSGRHRGDTTGGSGVQAGAQTVQSIASQLNQAGDDAGRD